MWNFTRSLSGLISSLHSTQTILPSSGTLDRHSKYRQLGGLLRQRYLRSSLALRTGHLSGSITSWAKSKQRKQYQSWSLKGSRSRLHGIVIPEIGYLPFPHEIFGCDEPFGADYCRDCVVASHAVALEFSELDSAKILRVYFLHFYYYSRS